MDHVDIAAETIETCTAEAERRARGKSAPESDPTFDGFHCVECGEDLPPIRLRMGKIRCVTCQTRLEKENQMRVYNVRGE